jgi:hypothetical protein
MPDLNDIIGAILRDVSEAQDTANRYSTDLASQYKQHPLLSVMSVPNALVSGVELELKYAIQSVTDEGQRLEQRRRRLFEAIEYYAPQAVQSAEKNVLQPMRKMQLSPAELQELTRGLIRELHEELLDTPAEELFNTRSPARHQARSYFNRELFRNLVQEALHDLLRDTFPDSQGTAPKEEGASASGKEAAEWNAALFSREVEAFVKGVSQVMEQPLDTARNRRLEVVVDSKELQSLPREAICTVKVQARLRNYKWTEITDDAGLAGDSLLIREDG